MKKSWNIDWRYTIGEILIVIVGISIAFALNNWAGNRKDQNLRQKYVENLREDLIADTLQLHENVKTLRERIDITKRIINAFRSRSSRMDTILQYLYQVPLPIDFHPRNVTYRSMINSGDLKLIDDFELKTKIQEHYLNYDHIIEVYERQNIIVDKYLGSFFIEKIDYNTLYKGDFSSLNDLGLINSISAMMGTYQLKIVESESGISSTKELIKQLN